MAPSNVRDPGFCFHGVLPASACGFHIKVKMAAPGIAIQIHKNEQEEGRAGEGHPHSPFQWHFQEVAHSTCAFISLARTLSHGKDARKARKCGLYFEQPYSQLKWRITLPRREQWILGENKLFQLQSPNELVKIVWEMMLCSEPVVFHEGLMGEPGLGEPGPSSLGSYPRFCWITPWFLPVPCRREDTPLSPYLGCWKLLGAPSSLWVQRIH